MARLQQRRTEIWLLFFVIISVAGASIFIYYRRKQKQKAAMDAAIIQHNDMMLKAVFDGQEEERRRIARELHDGVGQKLAGVKLNWEHISAGLDSNSQTDQLQSVTDLLDNAASEVRGISHQMMPKELEQYGLVPAINSILSNNLEHTNITYQFDSHGMENRLPELVELSLFRVLQEITSNAIKHAGAGNLDVQLLKRNNSIVLIAGDDGEGFDTDMENRSGIGLMNIESRINAIGGSLDIESQPGKGTTIRIRVPLNE